MPQPKDVEALGKKLGFMQSQKNFHNVSLGQGQEVVAEEAMEVAARDAVSNQFHCIKDDSIQIIHKSNF